MTEQRLKNESRLTPDRKAQFVKADAVESIEKLLKAVGRTGVKPLEVIGEISHRHLLVEHDWNGMEFGKVVNGDL